MNKKWTIEDIKLEIKKVEKKFNYEANIPIEISSRATKRLGAFFYKIENKKIKPIKFVFAKKLINGTYTEEIVKEVIAHEYIHYYCDTKTNKKNKHNSYFKSKCREYGIPDRATLKINLEKDITRNNSKVYKIYCIKCNSLVAIYKRKITAEDKIPKYISKCCKAKLYYKEELN